MTAARVRHRIGSLLPLVLAWPALRHAVESRMLLHMLLEFPLLLASGWSAAALLRSRRPGATVLDALDVHGLLGVTLLSCVAAFWMIPAALDLSQLSPAMQAAKLASWWGAGALLSHSAPRLSHEVLAFFAGNLAWMMATAGLMYQDKAQRLCVSYLVGDQADTGRGLVVASVLLGAVAVRRLVRPEALAGARLP